MKSPDGFISYGSGFTKKIAPFKKIVCSNKGPRMTVTHECIPKSENIQKIGRASCRERV